MDGQRIGISHGGRPQLQHVPQQHSAPQQPAPEKQDKKSKGKFKFSWKKWAILAAVAVLLAAVAVLTYGYIDTKRELTKLSKANSVDAAELERDRLTAEIGAYMELPKETPTLATVSDVTKLEGQEFFKNAQNGDRILIFADAQRALLYRPSTHKVIEYSRVSVGNSDQQATDQQQ